LQKVKKNRNDFFVVKAKSLNIVNNL
jgi:hypothetical protein